MIADLNTPTLDRGQRWASDALKISPSTLTALGIATGERRYFCDIGGDADAIIFGYPDGTWKARAVDEEAYTASPEFKPGLWNLTPVLRAISRGRVDRVYVAQGEFNACALVESGIPAGAVLSLPMGAKATRPDDGDRYAFVKDALAGGLSKAGAIVWCGNQDADGLALRDQMARLFGAARFAFVDWPDGSIDACDVLRVFGAEDLLDRVQNGAQPWPVAGLYRISELPDPPPLTLWSSGFSEWDAKLMLAPRTLSVVTGHPGHGKTLLWNQIWFQVAKAYDVRVASASFETRPKPHVRRQLRSLHSGALEKDLSFGETAAADAWIEDHYRFMVHPDQRPTLDWFLEMAEVAVIRDGVRVIQADPWNRFESARDARQESETDYIGRCLRKLHAFAHDLNVHVQILAHPAKMDSTRRGTAPLLEDISGSKNWDNAVDQGFVVHRDEIFAEGERKTGATLFCRKSRFEELGFPCALDLDFSLSRGSYRAVNYAPPPSKKPTRVDR